MSKRKREDTYAPKKKPKTYKYPPNMYSKANPFTRGEMKYYDAGIANTAIVSTNADWQNTELDPAALALFVPVLGNNIQNRIGRNVYVHSIKITYTVYMISQTAQSTADAGCVVRLLLYQDCQTNAVQAQGEQVLSPGGIADPTITNCSPMNVDNFGRFKILKDRTVNLSDPNITGSPTGADVIVNGKSVRGKMKIKFRTPVKVQFNATNGGTVADIVDNSFHLIGHATSSALIPRISYYSRIGFKEEN